MSMNYLKVKEAENNVKQKAGKLRRFSGLG